ncbi:MAG: hypothetical protein PVSMB7_30120 [Chloroflexota bacterium]
MIQATAVSPVWRQVKASYALVERNINLSKRYWGWEVAFLVYTIAQSMAIVFIAEAPGPGAGNQAYRHYMVLYLAIGTLTWSYMANLFMCIAESVQWERWEGTIEYTMMAPISKLTYMLGSCLFGVIYGLARTAVVLVALVFMFHLPSVTRHLRVEWHPGRTARASHAFDDDPDATSSGLDWHHFRPSGHLALVVGRAFR